VWGGVWSRHDPRVAEGVAGPFPGWPLAVRGCHVWRVERPSDRVPLARGCRIPGMKKPAEAGWLSTGVGELRLALASRQILFDDLPILFVEAFSLVSVEVRRADFLDFLTARGVLALAIAIGESHVAEFVAAHVRRP